MNIAIVYKTEYYKNLWIDYIDRTFTDSYEKIDRENCIHAFPYYSFHFIDINDDKTAYGLRFDKIWYETGMTTSEYIRLQRLWVPALWPGYDPIFEKMLLEETKEE